MYIYESLITICLVQCIRVVWTIIVQSAEMSYLVCSTIFRRNFDEIVY